jgi:hypothetical protein
MRPIQTRTDLRPAIVAPVNELADRIEVLLRNELAGADREQLRCALLTVAHRLTESPKGPLWPGFRVRALAGTKIPLQESKNGIPAGRGRQQV